MYYVLVAGSEREQTFPTMSEMLAFVEGALDNGAEQVQVRYAQGGESV